MKKYSWIVALVIAFSFVGTAVAAEGVKTTPDQAFLKELARQPTTPLLETLSGTPPQTNRATDYYICTHTFCKYTSDCTRTLTCEVGVQCISENPPLGPAYCNYL
jgi:hypothetical protein